MPNIQIGGSGGGSALQGGSSLFPQAEAKEKRLFQKDGDTGYELVSKNGAVTVKISGKVGIVFEGPVSTDEEILKVPAECQAKVKEMIEFIRK